MVHVRYSDFACASGFGGTVNPLPLLLHTSKHIIQYWSRGIRTIMCNITTINSPSKQMEDSYRSMQQKWPTR